MARNRAEKGAANLSCMVNLAQSVAGPLTFNPGRV